MARTIKHYGRAVLSSVGLFSKTALRLQLDEIRPDDTFINSFPKSGNTWVRFLIAHLISDEKKIDFRNIDAIVPDVYMHPAKVNAAKSPRYIKTHDPHASEFPKLIYIVRDYRDVLVSYFNYHCALGSYTNDINHFIKEVNSTHPFGEWPAHVANAFSVQKNHPEKILLLKYESLLSDPEKELKRIVEFTGLNPEKSLREIVDVCRFEMLRESEKKSGSEFKDKSGKLFFREGKAGGWKSVLTKEQEQLILKNEDTKKMMKALGYL